MIAFLRNHPSDFGGDDGEEERCERREFTILGPRIGAIALILALLFAVGLSVIRNVAS